jgi:3-oxoacyl-[acyl-carrier-protein] synthase II
MEKVVITGTGALTAIGNNTTENWDGILVGKSGLGEISLFDTTDFSVKIACEVKGLDIDSFIPKREARRMDRYQIFGSIAAREAIVHSGIEITENNAERIGVIMSTGIGGLGSLLDNVSAVEKGGPRKISPFMITMMMPNGSSGMIGIEHGLKGPTFCVVSACASSQDGMGIAWMMLKTGMADAMVVGGSEAIINLIGIGGFDRIRATSRKSASDLTPSPFDLNRDGLVVGEGAGAIVMETESHAKARGANILAELAGYGATGDAHHITAPTEDGIGGAAAMKQALRSAKINADEVNYINAHGTATPLNDAAETRGIKSVFGDHAYKIPVSSTKSMTGHMMGATGSVEAVYAINAIRNNILPPTINYQTPDPNCDLDYVPNEARDSKVSVVMSNAFGFGGHNSVIVIREY